MPEINPYAAPRARVDVAPPEYDAVWCEGDTVVIGKGGDLPPRCVKCNADARQPVRQRTLYWHTPWIYLLILASLLIYLIVALIARKSCKVSPGLCAQHHTTRNQVIIGCWLGVLLAIGLISVGIVNSSLAATSLGILIVVAAAIVGMVKGRMVYCTGIDAQRVQLKGCGQAFLASLPRRR